MINQINNAWSWKGIEAVEIIQTNDFGNIIFKTSTDNYWRIYPEELLIEKISDSKKEFQELLKDLEFIEDWEMKNLVEIATKILGALDDNQKFCLKIPAVIGGTYEIENIGKIDFNELIAISGDLAFQIKDLKDGQTIKLKTK